MTELDFIHSSSPIQSSCNLDSYDNVSLLGHLLEMLLGQLVIKLIGRSSLLF